jgi:hypothetical protein
MDFSWKTLETSILGRVKWYESKWWHISEPVFYEEFNGLVYLGRKCRKQELYVSFRVSLENWFFLNFSIIETRFLCVQNVGQPRFTPPIYPPGYPLRFKHALILKGKASFVGLNVNQWVLRTSKNYSPFQCAHRS